jgi:hypothetical protein
VVAYFDPLSAFSYSYFANLKRVDIAVVRGRPIVLATPLPDPSVNAVVAYNSFWVARYAPDSTDAALHLLIEPTPRVTGLYPSEIIEDSRTQLPSHIQMRGVGGDDETITFDYQVIEGHWVLVHATFTATQHAVIGSFKTITDVSFSDIAFPTQAPDPRLAGSVAPATPSPSPTP